MKITSAFGAFLDPVADKIMVGSVDHVATLAHCAVCMALVLLAQSFRVCSQSFAKFRCVFRIQVTPPSMLRYFGLVLAPYLDQP